MAILNYQKKFAPLVEKGIKRQTIRARRKRPVRVGENLYHYTGLYTKSARLLRRCPCNYVADIDIDLDIDKRIEVVINRETPLSYEEKEALAKKDGFSNMDEMFNFFKDLYGLPFYGQIIRW